MELERHLWPRWFLCPCGVGVSVSQPGQCRQLPSPHLHSLSNLVIYVGRCRHGPHCHPHFIYWNFAVVLSLRLYPHPIVE